MDASRSYHLGSDGCISIVDACRKRTLPGWQQWMHLDRGCLSKPDVTRLAAMDASRTWMLAETGRCHVGSDGCMWIVDASRNTTLPGWQRWMNLDRAIRNRPYCGLGMDALVIGCLGQKIWASFPGTRQTWCQIIANVMLRSS